MSSALLPVRRRLNDWLMRAVAGDDHHANVHRVHATVGPRRYGPDDPIQIVGNDAAMYIGGMVALLLQSLHPLPMSAVADFSDYQDNPYDRLAGTATFLADQAFATVEHADAAVERVRRIHRHVTGVTPDGVPYRADDPHLLTWVHCAEVWSFLRAHSYFGARRLTAAQADEYVRQMGRTARALGAEQVPESVAELDEFLMSFRPELDPLPSCLEVVNFIIRKPPVPVAARPVYALLAAGAIATLPRWSRGMLGLPNRPVLERTCGRAAGRIATAGLRWILGVRVRPEAG